MHSAEDSFRGIRCRWHHSLARPARSKQYDLGQIVVHATQLLNRSPCHVSVLASVSGVSLRRGGVSYLVSRGEIALVARGGGAPRSRHRRVDQPVGRCAARAGGKGRSDPSSGRVRV